MDNELMTNSKHDALDLYNTTSDLLAVDMVNSSLKRPLEHKNLSKEGYLAFGYVWKLGTVVLGMGATLVAEFAIDLNMIQIIGYGTVLPVAGIAVGHGFTLLSDKKRLDRSMKSKDPKKRAYYVNRVLSSLVAGDLEKTSLFDNPYILAYALWLNEKSLSLNSYSGESTKEYRKFIADVTMDDFKTHLYYDSYIDIARDMVDGLIPKRAIPLTMHEENRKIYSKAEYIVKSRKYFIGDKEKPWNILKQIEVLQSQAGSQDYIADMELMKEIEREWFDTQSDITQILKYPLFSDAREPLVQSFHTKLTLAQSLSKKVLSHEFLVAVSDLKTAWTLLSHEAHRVELSKFDENERKKILLAKNLMDIALNIASTPSERQSAYKQAMEKIKGLIVVPKSALLSLEQSVSRTEILSLDA